MAFGETGDLAESADAIQKDDITNEGNYMGSTGGHHAESNWPRCCVQGSIRWRFHNLVADINTESTDGVDNTYGISADYAFSATSLSVLLTSLVSVLKMMLVQQQKT